MPTDGPPKWFHAHGFKMVPGAAHLEVVPHGTPFLVIGTEFARLQLYSDEPGRYQVHWFIGHSFGRVEGHITMSHTEVRAAFGIADQSGNKVFADAFNADCASPGRYIRKGPYLNLPMPGTGTDGDPNISIYIDEKIRRVIRKLLAK